MTQRLAMLVSNQPRDDQEERKREKERIEAIDGEVAVQWQQERKEQEEKIEERRDERAKERDSENTHGM